MFDTQPSGSIAVQCNINLWNNFLWKRWELSCKFSKMVVQKYLRHHVSSTLWYVTLIVFWKLVLRPMLWECFQRWRIICYAVTSLMPHWDIKKSCQLRIFSHNVCSAPQLNLFSKVWIWDWKFYTQNQGVKFYLMVLKASFWLNGKPKHRLLTWIQSLQNIFRLPGILHWKQKNIPFKSVCCQKIMENMQYCSFLHWDRYNNT